MKEKGLHLNVWRVLRLTLKIIFFWIWRNVIWWRLPRFWCMLILQTSKKM